MDQITQLVRDYQTAEQILVGISSTEYAIICKQRYLLCTI